MTMRSMKTTSISFGLVNVPVKMYKATLSHDISFSQFHAGDCMGSIGYTKVCKCCGEVVEADKIARGVRHGDQVVTVTDEELAGIDVQVGPEIAVVQFVDAGEIDPVAMESHYYVAPDKTSLEGFTLLRQVMVDTNRVAIVRYYVRRSGSTGKTHLGMLRPYGDKAMIVDTIAYPDEVRTPDFPVLETKVVLNPRLVEMAHELVDAMSGPFDASEYTDTYSEQIGALVEAKAAGGFVAAPQASPSEGATDVSDLLAKLEASAAAKKSAKAPAKAAPKAPAAKRAPAKAAPKAPAAKRAPAKRAKVVA